MPGLERVNSGQPDSDPLSSFQNPRDGCPDWIVSTGSDISIVKDRESFISYTPFSTKAKSALGGDLDALGVGTIAIRVACEAPKNENVLTLDEVLYSPSSFCNVLGQDFLNTYDPQGLNSRYPMSNEPYHMKGPDGSSVGMLKWHPRAGLLQLCLAPESSRTNLDPNGQYVLTVFWSQAERQRWNDYRYGVTPLTSDEKRWLKDKGYKDEWTFLQMYGLKMDDDEDRQEGRNILREMKSKIA